METRSAKHVKEFSKTLGNAKIDVKVNGHFNGFGLIEKTKRLIQRIVMFAMFTVISLITLVIMSAIIIGMLATN